MELRHWKQWWIKRCDDFKNNVAVLVVFQLGAGTALPGIVAAKVGANVTLSDACHLDKCLTNCRQSCLVNAVEDIKIIGVTWGQVNIDLAELGEVDIILSSDCFYDSKDFEDILVTVKYLLNKKQNVQFWTTYQERRYI